MSYSHHGEMLLEEVFIPNVHLWVEPIFGFRILVQNTITSNSYENQLRIETPNSIFEVYAEDITKDGTLTNSFPKSVQMYWNNFVRAKVLDLIESKNIEEINQNTLINVYNHVYGEGFCDQVHAKKVDDYINSVESHKDFYVQLVRNMVIDSQDSSFFEFALTYKDLNNLDKGVDGNLSFMLRLKGSSEEIWHRIPLYDLPNNKNFINRLRLFIKNNKDFTPVEGMLKRAYMKTMESMINKFKPLNSQPFDDLSIPKESRNIKFLKN